MLNIYNTYRNVKLLPWVFASLMALPIVIFPFSPLLSYYISIILLLTLSELCNSRPVRVYLSIIALVSGSLIAASRMSLRSLSDDFGHYYDSYLSILHGGTIFQYASGFEFFISLYFKLMILVSGELHPSSILFFVALLNSFLFYLWLEKFGLEKVDSNVKSLCVAASLTFYMFPISTLLMRQMLATPLLLFAISYTLNNKKGIFFFLLACFAHSSSAPIYFIVRMLMSENKKNKNIMVLFFMLFLLSFSLLVKYAASLSGIPIINAITYKLDYYSTATLFDFSKLDSYVKYLIVMVLSSFYFFSKEHRDWKSLLYYSGIIYLILLPIPFMSGRLFLILSAVGLGYMLFLSAYKISMVFRYLMIIFCVFRILTLGIYYTNTNDGFDLWYSYPWISENAFYFVI